MNCRYLIILLFLCGNCNGNGLSPFSGCGCGGSAQRDGQRNGPRGSKINMQRECGCDDERTQGYGGFGYDGGMTHTRDFAGYANSGTCGCEEKQENDRGCVDS